MEQNSERCCKLPQIYSKRPNKDSILSFSLPKPRFFLCCWLYKFVIKDSVLSHEWITRAAERIVWTHVWDILSNHSHLSFAYLSGPECLYLSQNLSCIQHSGEPSCLLGASCWWNKATGHHSCPFFVVRVEGEVENQWNLNIIFGESSFLPLTLGYDKMVPSVSLATMKNCSF